MHQHKGLFLYRAMNKLCSIFLASNLITIKKPKTSVLFTLKQCLRNYQIEYFLLEPLDDLIQRLSKIEQRIFLLWVIHQCNFVFQHPVQSFKNLLKFVPFTFDSFDLLVQQFNYSENSQSSCIIFMEDFFQFG